MMTLDNTTVYNYSNYAASSFNKVSAISTVGTACTILFAVAKPPVAKFSDVVGRAEAYCFTVSCYVLGYILSASSKSFGVYAGGQVFYTIGKTGTNIMNDIIISDITSMRWRTFALSFLFFPFLIIPWVSAFITEAVIGGIGWRWGIGMFAILMPFCASFIVIPLLYFQRKAKKSHIILTRKMSVASFCSLIDLGGSFLLCAGLAMFLLPFTLAATTTNRWSTPYIDVLIALGVVTLIALVPYEKYVAKHPILPPHYFKNSTIILCGLIGAFDTMAFGATHTYLYAWSTIVHNFGPRDATFLQYTNGVWQFFVAMIIGLVIGKLRRYKWFVVAGACVRFIGYGLMVRWRGASNSIAELFVVQSIQGIGDGLIVIVIIVGAQIVVPHAEMAQVTAVMLLFQFVGSSIGTAIAGGIYTGTFKDRLRARLGGDASQSVIDAVFNSITNGIPPEGSAERVAVGLAYSDVLRYISYVALGVSVLILGMAIFLPDLYLREGHNLVAAADADDERLEHSTTD
ncbi:MFS general substrate transporter [Mytilinidion resinicola]|uniref:MFS general substrate transporter n=1 Tax=Mytilinidion resinicola TaxID=574789 RepID=A0A6A6Z4Y0_9PEZI|nr:MFS general substrate transporter [Mytilinidion resinicola]KAF2815235.1 MFS general substrate transporter [Mytilinidion resinicola]